MYAVTSSMKGTTCRRFANMVFKKVDIKVRRYSSHALNMKLSYDDLNKTKDRMLTLPFRASSIFSVNSYRNLNPRTRKLSTAAASFVGDNSSTTTTAVLPVHDSGSRGVARIGEAKKTTKIETNVSVKINLNGTGVADSDSGIPFLDKMIHEFASQGLFDVHVKATGDIDVDERLTNEDAGHAIGIALQDAVGDNKDIKRFGSFFAPHHEVLIHVAIELSGHSHLDFKCHFHDEDEDDDDGFGTYQTELFEPFFKSLVNTSGMTLHIQKLSGSNPRHLIEATFKAFAGALRQATEFDPRRRPLLLAETLPTSKD